MLNILTLNKHFYIRLNRNHYILHIASEIAPIAKAGGLGDVVYGLAQECTKLGHRVEVLIPKYDSIDYSLLKDLRPEYLDLWSYEGPYSFHNTVWSASFHGLRCLLLEPHHPAYLFNRGKIYGCLDDVDRFIYFSRAALEYVYKSEKRPDVIHLHDWPTALTAVLYKEMYIPLHLQVGKIVLTIHNLAYQGLSTPNQISSSGLRGSDLLHSSKMQDPKNSSLLNILKGGLIYSDALTTVSPTYKEEILSSNEDPLSKTVSQNSFKLTGILNGIDFSYWDPENDPFIPHPYTVSSFKEGKSLNKRELRKKLGLPSSQKPIICSITRLVSQKSPELILALLEATLDYGAQFILVGSTSDPKIEEQFLALRTKYAKNKNLSMHLNYDEGLSHLVYAGSDAIIIPSQFEPCGLTQMIGLRYGTLPIVRKTGGLADTVFDEKNGFTFSSLSRKEATSCLNKALLWFKEKKDKWDGLIKTGMTTDFSWKKSAVEYLKLYAPTPKK